MPGRWLAAGGATVLAGIVGVALAVQTGAGPACAAPPTGDEAHKGKATFYDLKSGGNCSTATPADRMFVALGPSEYSAAAACGGYLDVTGPKGKVRVKITDQCPECPSGHIDLSREAFARIGNPVQGIIPITYRAAVNAPVPGPLSFRIKEGSSQYWFAVLVDNHANPLRSVEAKGPGGAWRDTARQSYNYWLVDSGLGPGPYSIRVTDVYGRQATATGITMSPGKTQQTDIRLSGSAGPARGSATKPRPSGNTRAKASPTASRTAPAKKRTNASPSPVVTSPGTSPAPAAAAGTPVAQATPLSLAADGDSCG